MIKAEINELYKLIIENIKKTKIHTKKHPATNNRVLYLRKDLITSLKVFYHSGPGT